MKFMKAIEKGELTTVMQLVKSNPRYLIGGGDKPTILQQGCRYNALHVCCKYNQLQVCKYLIDELMGVDLYVTMYPDDKWESRRMRMTFLLDYYLNNREKGVSIIYFNYSFQLFYSQ
ncbi:hypothetical protein HELRODRAFT_89576 [Helobdella robusta]|uniref:Uncharacterized protein n=1 Tax=Helobdella robusta TaxID=6412 RepID=T1G7E6_HELRO|nr:hypothetical protein HELRODRAFT_89576 [Helobdella robusta]ESN92360.1 hypothetical protein HELRODRAFT_89576 [Helobdella robusta]